ncbi:MAG: anthranilate phosphoribosyltransferase [Chitinophagaceae bacterium]
MKNLLQYLFSHKTLSKQQAKEALLAIAQGAYTEYEVTAFVTVYLMRTITIEELLGFREALLELCIPIHFNEDVLDIVGTGGDGKNTFNISTLACFIAAGAGVKVAKHGNYGASSISGASNVMEALGYKHKNDNKALQHELDAANICFLHAPMFHPALKSVAPMRKSLGVRTFFNMLGPLVNPAQPAYQLIGVYNVEMARVYNYVLQHLGKPFTIIHGLDGYDEISLTNDTKVITQQGEFIIDAITLGKRWVTPDAIEGGTTVEASATIFKNILEGKGTWSQNAVVLANAAKAMECTGIFASYKDAYAAAVDSLEQGKALEKLNTLIALQQ